VTRDLHGDPLGHARIDHVPDGGAPKVMPQHAYDSDSLARSGPSPSEIATPLSSESTAQVREQERDDGVCLPLDCGDSLDLGDQQISILA